ncbi:Zn-ribbon domain-containing OB-fold protein [Actinoallomurus acanthiterrae]
MSGHGTIYSYTEVHRPPAGFTDLAPYAVALVDLDEGTRAMGRVITDDPESVRIGRRVVTVLEETADGRVLPQFALADEAHGSGLADGAVPEPPASGTDAAERRR